MDNAIWQPTDVGINAPSVSSILEPDGDNLIVHVINDEYWDTANVANIKIFTDMRLCRAVPNNYPEPDWSDAPEWAQWWAVDVVRNNYSRAFWFENEPGIADGIWDTLRGGEFQVYGPVDLPFGCDYRLTLRKRPEVTK